MELARLELTLRNETKGKEPPGIYASSLMHGVIMEMLESAYAEQLHGSPVNEFAQHIQRVGENQSKWVITTVTEEAKEKIFLPLLAKSGKKIYLKHNDQDLTIVKQEFNVMTEDELMDHTYFARSRKVVPLRFVTPVSFRVNGKYQIYPTVRHILQSLIRKHDVVSAETEVYQEGLLEKIEEMTEIIGYDLHSTGFPLEGVKIPSFRGSVRILVRGPERLAALIRMLAEFGAYSGVGIKCAMGMGAMCASDQEGLWTKRE